jgi:ferredoxin/coenzyme F420-reducing hydrogenase delta subunit
MERLFDRLLGEQLNPLYRSGTLAVMFLLLACASGLYLIFFYRLGDPYASVQRLQADPWVGRWMRAWHRYLSDAAMLATGVHALRMLAEGKAWGPRALAWISGLVLMGMLALVGWTGFVMVWDGHALALARAGARVADQLPIFAEPISRAFDGAAQPPPSFFFMNLFLHVAAPLGLVFVLWLHTSRLARSAWLPERRGLWLWGAALAVAALLLPVTLGPKADTLALGFDYWLSPFYSPWLPASLAAAPAWTLGLAVLAGLLLAALPWLWRPPARREPAPSHNDEARCQGCVTCVHDCPFEAISMVPRSAGSGSALVARVDPALCVSCGICVASCDRLSIGPPDRVGTRQMALAQGLGRAAGDDAIVIIGCRQGALLRGLTARAQAAGLRVVPWSLDCAGDLHPFSVHALQQSFRGVLVASCAPSACQMRLGADLARRRLVDKQEPANKVGLDDARLRLLQRPDAELEPAWAELRAFAGELGLLGPAPAPPQRRIGPWRAFAAMLPLAALLAALAALKAGAPAEGAALRLAWRLPGQAVRDCRDLSAAELAERPAHMRQTRECVSRRLSYRLKASLDGEAVIDQVFSPRGIRGDSPLNVDLEWPLDPGRHRLRLSFVPEGDDQGQGLRLEVDRVVELKAGRVLLVSLDRDNKHLEIQ